MLEEIYTFLLWCTLLYLLYGCRGGWLRGLYGLCLLTPKRLVAGSTHFTRSTYFSRFSVLL